MAARADDAALQRHGGDRELPRGSRGIARLNHAVEQWVREQAEDVLAKDMPVIPLRFGQNNFVYSTNVANVSVDLFGNVNIFDITTSAT